MKRLFLPFLLCLSLALAACGGSSQITVVDAWARPAKAGQNSAAYFQMHNYSDSADALLKVEGSLARAIEMHMSMAMETSDAIDGTLDAANGGLDMGDVMQMLPQERIEIPAGESLIFRPGALHAMIIDLHSDLAVGDHFPLTLVFESGLSIELDVEVKSP